MRVGSGRPDGCGEKTRTQTHDSHRKDAENGNFPFKGSSSFASSSGPRVTVGLATACEHLASKLFRLWCKAVRPLPEGQRATIGQAIDEYLDFIKAHRKERTYVTYRYTLDKLLRQWCRKSYVDQVTREDILQFMTDCYKHGLGKRTVYDKLVVVLQLFKRYGKIKLIESSDWPHYVETIRPIY